MRQLFKYMLVVLTCSVMLSCGDKMEYSPFQSDVPKNKSGLTEKNLALIADLPTTTAYKVALITDVHYAYNEFHEIIDHINARDDIAFVCFLGDITDLGLKHEYIWFEDAASELDVPFVTVIGNHDLWSNGENIYKQMFGAFNYSFSYSGTKFIALNTNYGDFANPVPDSDWLENQLGDIEDFDHVVIITHKPPLSFHGTQIDRAVELIKNADVDLVLSGHTNISDDRVKQFTRFIVLPNVEKNFYGILSIDPTNIEYEEIELSQKVRK